MAGQAAEVVKVGAEKQSALAKLSTEQRELLRNFIAPGFDDSQLAFFLAVAEKKQLDPFTRQIYAVKRKVNVKTPTGWVETEKIDVMTGVDGYRSIAARCGDYAPGDETITMAPDGITPVSATVTVRKFIQGQWIAFSGTAYFEEYAARYKDKTGEWRLTDMWLKMPRSQITKCAEVRALRKGWPEPLSDLYVSEEMERAQIEEQPSSQFAALAQETPAAIPPPVAAPAPQVVSAPPPAAAKPAQQQPPAKVVDMQQARAEQQRPASKPGEGLPEMWDVTEAIPAAVLLWLKPLAPLAGKSVQSLPLNELELVIETVKKGYAQAAAKPNVSKQGLKLLATIAASAQATYDRKMGEFVAQNTPSAPPMTDDEIPAEFRS